MFKLLLSCSFLLALVVPFTVKFIQEVFQNLLAVTGNLLGSCCLHHVSKFQNFFMEMVDNRFVF